MKSIKQKIMQNRIQVQIEMSKNSLMKSISTRIKLLMCTGTCIQLLTRCLKSKVNTLKRWIVESSHQHWKSQKKF